VALALLAGQAGILTAQAAPPVDSPGPPSADGVTPVIADTQSSNDDCGQLGVDHGISIPRDGRASIGAMTVIHVSAGNETEQAPGNDESNEVSNSAECEEPGPPDLQVTKTSDAGGILHDGDSFLYTITVTNVGDVQATGVELIDALPPGDVLSISVSPFPMFDGHPCVIASSIPPGGTAQATVNCGPITLGPGDSASVTFRVAVTGEGCGAITNVVDVEGSDEPTANIGPDNHAEASDEIGCAPRIRLRKGGPAIAHVGDAVAYSFSVTNTGGVDLTDIDLTDPRCDTTPDRTDDGNGDAVLAVDESWAFACAHTIVAADGDPVHDQATVTGVHDRGTVSDTDTHDIDLIHPDIDLEKSASPTSGPAGTVIVYTYSVANTGDTTLFDISVDDDIVGHVGTIASLAAGQSGELTFEITLGSSPITNVATATGSDVLGASVSDVDEVTVAAVAGGGGGDGGEGTGAGSPFTGAATGTLSAWAMASALVGSLLLLGTSRKPRQTDSE
jgi:uncharacterized repeat protein (TIGR01451 family)